MKSLLSLAVLLILTGCATTKENCAIQTSTGTCMGNAEFRKIMIAQSHYKAPIDIIADITKTVARDAGSLHQEFYLLENGLLRMSSYYKGGFDTDLSDRDFAGNLEGVNILGKKIASSSLEVKNKGDAKYVLIDRGANACIYVNYFFGASRELTSGPGKRSEMQGYVCAETSQFTSEFQNNFLSNIAKIKEK